MPDAAAKQRALELFQQGTPTSSDAPIEAWRSGFEAMAAKIAPPADLEVSARCVGGVPGLEVRAPGAATDRQVVHFHSGGYVMGSAHAYREFGGRLSAACNAPVFLPDYRLAPENPYPAAAEDGLAVYRALLDECAPSSLIVSGDSAGGGLCIATLQGARDVGLAMPAGAIAISPLLDLAGEGNSANIATDPLINREIIVGMGKVYIGEIDPHVHPAASPLWGEQHGLPPLLLLASSSEALRDDTVRLAVRVAEAQGEVRMSLYPDLVHIWTFFPFLDASRRALDEIALFARTCWATAD